jgi:hypothetical protein
MSLPVGKDQVGMNMPSRLSKSLFLAADRQLIPATDNKPPMALFNLSQLSMVPRCCNEA